MIQFKITVPDSGITREQLEEKISSGFKSHRYGYLTLDKLHKGILNVIDAYEKTLRQEAEGQ